MAAQIRRAIITGMLTINLPRTGPASVASAPPDAVELAILRTVVYADVFDYGLNAAQIHRYLIGCRATPLEVRTALESSAWLADRLTTVGGFYGLAGRGPLAARRIDLARGAEPHWRHARRWAARIGALPFVRMVAVTGALAMDNAPPRDDVDLLIVTEPGRVWLGRALVIGLVYLARLSGVGLCPNYVLSRTALEQVQTDLYTAHDLAQMVPLAGQAVYTAMRRANRWTDAYLPQAHAAPRDEADLAPRGLARALQRLGEWLLGGSIGDGLENWERGRKQRKFARQVLAAGPAALLDADHVKGHFVDHRQAVLRAYAERLRRYPELD